MRDIPECMNRRYQALDELIEELATAMADRGSPENLGESNDPSVKLMCEFWNILKEDPDCNLPQAVQQRMGVNPKSSRSFRPQQLACYMASKDNCSKDNKNKKYPEEDSRGGCCSSKSASPKTLSDNLPLSKVLCNLKEALSFDKKCNSKISELMATQQQLQDQIQQLEERELEGTQLLKQADSMWSCMEEAYKKKVAESLERQNTLLKEMKEIETSNAKWRKNKKELEFQLGNVNKCYQEIKEKLQEKGNDVKCIKMEVENFTKRAEANKKETAAAKKSFTNKKSASSARIANMSAEITRIQQMVHEEQSRKRDMELEGSKHVKEAREDLQKIYRVLLQKKLENEDLRAEKEALVQEIELLRKTCDQCKEKCQNKHKTILDEIAKLDAEIAGFKIRCIKCHEFTDTGDSRKCCTDCPRCADERECLYEDGHCVTDATMDCVCMSTKQKLMDNVFENMYTVLERQAKTPPGKAVADAVLNCLKKSRNGKLNEETRKILQNFVLTTVKKNLNLTIIGGAVKTRCEMDPETYQQLMLCLKQVKTAPQPKEDKGTVPKKDPCSRWGGTSECNCPKGPKSCICGKKAPSPPNDPDKCPPTRDQEDAGEVVICPHKESAACGVDCAMHAVPSAVGTDVAAWRPAPCNEKHCTFSKNMRAAQCFLGPDSLTSPSKTKGYKTDVPTFPDVSVLKNQIICKCGPTPTNPCTCRKDTKHLNTEVKQCDESNCVQAWEQNIRDSKNEANKIAKFVEHKKISPLSLEKEKIITETSRNLQKDNKIRENFENCSDSINTNRKSDESKKSSSDSKSVSFRSSSKKNDQKRSYDDTFKVSINSKSGHLNNQYTKLATSPSGALIMELDEEIIQQIEQKMNNTSNILVYLRKSASGHCILDFDTKEEHSNKMFIVKKSPSGTLLFEVDVNTVDELRANIVRTYSLNSISSFSKVDLSINDNDRIKNEFFKSDTSSVSCDIIKAQKHACCLERVPLNADDNSDSDEHTTVALQIEEENGQFTKSNAFLRITDSGKTSLVLKSLSSVIVKLLENIQQNPVLLTQSSFNTYLLETKSSEKNAFIVRTVSGRFMITLFDKLSVHKTENNLNGSIVRLSDTPDYFRFRLRGPLHNISCLPAILKSTDSHNYVLVVDKEYVKQYKETLTGNFGTDFDCPIELSITLSGSIEIEFIDIDGSTVIPNALLTIATPGNIKIFTDSKRCSVQSNTKSFTSESNPLKIFSEMVSRLPEVKRDRKPLKAFNIMDKKSSSDSNLYEKVKMQLHNQQSLLAEPSAMLRRTPSGQFTVVLNKESKKAFINKLKSYLSSNPQGLVPITRSEQGEITITLNKESDVKSQYGSLKITPSGSIFVLVDEKYITKMTKDTENENPVIITDTNTLCHSSDALKYVANKCVTTTCNALPDKSCDSTKCVCSEIIRHGVNNLRFDSNSVKSVTTINYCPEENHQYDYQISNCNNKTPDKYVEDMTNIAISRNKSPHIVIKPLSCRSNSPKGSLDSNQQFFYMTESICPFHKDRYESVSNDLIEISGFCTKTQKYYNNERDNENNTHKLKQSNRNFVHFRSDYLDYLPPQLPPFLRDFKCA